MYAPHCVLVKLLSVYSPGKLIYVAHYGPNYKKGIIPMKAGIRDEAFLVEGVKDRKHRGIRHMDHLSNLEQKKKDLSL